jgi:hypothetical protein
MATYTVQQVSEAGTLGTYTAVSATDTFTPLNDLPHILHVKNAGGSSDTVTVDDPNSVTPVAATAFNPDPTGVVANATERFFRIDPRRCRNSGTGLVTVTHSFTTTVTAAVFVG